MNPAATGTWYPYMLNYDISSWEAPFYWNIYANYTAIPPGSTP
jgi:hypothetical protein